MILGEYLGEGFGEFWRVYVYRSLNSKSFRCRVSKVEDDRSAVTIDVES